MGAKGTWTRAFCQRARAVRALCLGLACLGSALAGGARAGEPAGGPVAERRGDAPYYGAFWAAQVHTGLIWRRAAGAGEGPGPLIGVSARVATLMSLLDLQLEGRAARYEAVGGSGAATDVARYSLGLELRLHPFFVEHLRGTAFHYWKAALFLAVGGGLEVFDSDGAAGDATRAAFGWHLGLGTDIPLGAPRGSGSVWLGLGYRYLFLGPDSGVAGLGDCDEHQLLLTLAWRGHSIAFGRLPRPPELDDREPPPR